MNIIYLNGKFIPKADAKISVLDRGFLFGDGIYEVIPVYEKKPVGLELHLARLQKSLDAIGMKSPYTTNEWITILKKLAQLNDMHDENFSFYLQVTRGTAFERTHEYSDELTPTIMVFCKSLTLDNLSELAKGFKAIIVPDLRREHCCVKSINLLPNILAYQKAHLAGASEAIMIKNQYAIEASHSNLFIVKNGLLITPPLSPKILAGITRHIVLELAKNNYIPYEERDIRQEELFDADEIWVTGSSKEICPITQLNDDKLQTKMAGPLWHRIYSLYQQHKNEQTPLW